MDRDAAVVFAATPMLSFGAVGDAGPIVGLEDKVVRTSTRESAVRRDETEMGALAVVCAAWVCVRQLTKWVVNVDVVRTMRCVPQDLQVLARELVSSEQGFDVPVRPVEPVVHD